MGRTGRRGFGVFVDSTVAALVGLQLAAVYQQLSFVQQRFEGAFRLPVTYLCRFLGLGDKAARNAVRKLEEAGWLSVERRGSDPSWWVTVHEDVAEAAIAAARAPAVHWEDYCQGDLVSPGHGSGGETPAGAAKRRAPPGETPPAPSSKRLSKTQEPEGFTASSQKVAGAAQPSAPQPRRGACGADHGPHGVRPDAWASRVHSGPSAPSQAAGAQSLGERLRAAYPHPANGNRQARVPSAQQIECWLLALRRNPALPADWRLPVEEILAGAQREAEAARRDPEAYRRTLRNWLEQLGWEETLTEEPEPQRRSRPASEVAAEAEAARAKHHERAVRKAEICQLPPLVPKATRDPMFDYAKQLWDDYDPNGRWRPWSGRPTPAWVVERLETEIQLLRRDGFDEAAAEHASLLRKWL